MIQVKVNIPGYTDHPLTGDWSWPAVPTVGEFVQWKFDTFKVHNVSYEVDERGLAFVYLILRVVSIAPEMEEVTDG